MTPGAAVLTVSESGDGTVTSNPPGINCGPGAGQCSATFPPGQVVSLTATPGTGSTFAGWGGACSGTGGCTVTLTAATAVSATFVHARCGGIDGQRERRRHGDEQPAGH